MTDDAIGQLMRDFRCKNPEDIQNVELAKGVKYFKENEGGRKVMCEAVERYAEQKATKTLIEEGIQFGIEKERIIQRLCAKYSISEEQAERMYERYAPVVV